MQVHGTDIHSIEVDLEPVDFRIRNDDFIPDYTPTKRDNGIRKHPNGELNFFRTAETIHRPTLSDELDKLEELVRFISKMTRPKTVDHIVNYEPDIPRGLAEIHDFQETNISFEPGGVDLEDNPFVDEDVHVEYINAGDQVDGDQVKAVAVLSPPVSVMDKHLPVSPDSPPPLEPYEDRELDEDRESDEDSTRIEQLIRSKQSTLLW